MFASCAADANFRSYVAAHRASYTVLSTHYKGYLEKDTSLSEQDKATHLRRVEEEGKMITEAEKLLGVKQ